MYTDEEKKKIAKMFPEWETRHFNHLCRFGLSAHGAHGFATDLRKLHPDMSDEEFDDYVCSRTFDQVWAEIVQAKKELFKIVLERMAKEG